MQRTHFLILLALAGSLYFLTCRAHDLACATDATLLQSTTSTPARVTGARGEHLALHLIHPQALDSYDGLPPKPMYLLAGDSVDEIATCGEYVYVRYQGHTKVSTGWVQKARLKVAGAPHPRPKDTVAQICEAASRVVNAAMTPFALDKLRSVPMPQAMQKRSAKIADSMWQLPTDMVRIKSGSHVLKIVSVQDGGSCASNYMQVWPENGIKPLSTTMPDYSAGAYMGDQQEMVEVLGHPLVLEYVQNDPNSFTLATLDARGKQTKLCSIKEGYAAPSYYLAHSYGGICRAVVTGQARAIPMHDGEKDRMRFPEKSGWNFASLNSMRVASSSVDLFNDGKPRKVALVHHERDSSAGCGYAWIATVPVIINAQGVANLASPVNQKLVRQTTGDSLTGTDEPDYPSSGELVTVAGHVYYLMYVQPKVPEQSPTDGLGGVLKFTATGAKRVCKYQPYVYRVQPIAGLGHHVVP